MLIRAAIAWTLLASTAAATSQHVVVVLDDSGSMADRMRATRVPKIDAAKQALRVVLEKLPDDAQVVHRPT